MAKNITKTITSTKVSIRLATGEHMEVMLEGTPGPNARRMIEKKLSEDNFIIEKAETVSRRYSLDLDTFLAFAKQVDEDAQD